MQISFSFQPHELPAFLAELIKLASGDVSAIVSAAGKAKDAEPAPYVAQPAADEPTDFGGMLPPITAFAPQPAAQPAPVADEPVKQRRTRGPNKPKMPAPHTTPVDQAHLPLVPQPTAEAPASTLAHSAPSSVAAASPVVQTPPAAAIPTSVPPALAPVAPHAAAGGSVSLDDVRHAYKAAEERGVTDLQVMGLLVRFGASKFSDTKPEHYAAIVGELNSLTPSA
jgi:hypothetical protein